MMATFLFKFSACLAIFWLVYVLLLERQTVHRFKRFYLLGSLVLSLLIPQFTITRYVEPVVNTFETPLMELPSTMTVGEVPTEATPFFTTKNMLWTIYGLGVLLFSLRFLLNLYNMYRRISNHKHIIRKPFIYVLLDQCRIPHSFFKYLFFDKTSFETETIPKEVLLHEQTHAKQLHSLDILILELLQIVFWFHPLIYLLKHHIKLNHEFLADEAVLNQGAEAKDYQNLLLQFSSNAHEYQFSSTINYSSFKKRFTVMKTQTSKTRIWLSSFLILPIIAILFYGFSSKEYVEKSATIGTEENNNQAAQKKATKKQVADYNAWAKTMNKAIENSGKGNYMGANYSFFNEKEYDTYEYIYIKLMSPEQRDNAEPFPKLFPPPPPPPPAPVAPPTPKSKDKTDDIQNKNTIAPVEITIKKDNSLMLNGTPIKFEELTTVVDKLNSHLTIEEKRNYVNASIKLETNDSKDLAKKIGQELTKVDVFSNCIIFNVDDIKQKIPSNHSSPNAGLTIEEAKAKKENDLKAYKESLKSETNKPKSPWAISMGTNSEETVDNSRYKQGPIEINGATYYFTEQNGKKTYYDSYGKEVDINYVPPPDLPSPPSPENPTSNENKSKKRESNNNNPSFLEYIIEMENKGATFFMDGKKITPIEAKALAKNNKGKDTEMITHKDANGNFVVKLSKPKEKDGSNTQNQTSILPLINGKKVNSEQLSMTANEFKSIVLSLPNSELQSFKLKIPGSKTEAIKGDKISKEAISILNKAVTKDLTVLIFNITDDRDTKVSPLSIKIIE